MASRLRWNDGGIPRLAADLAEGAEVVEAQEFAEVGFGPAAGGEALGDLGDLAGVVQQVGAAVEVGAETDVVNAGDIDAQGDDGAVVVYASELASLHGRLAGPGLVAQCSWRCGGGWRRVASHEESRNAIIDTRPFF